MYRGVTAPCRKLRVHLDDQAVRLEYKAVMLEYKCVRLEFKGVRLEVKAVSSGRKVGGRVFSVGVLADIEEG